MTRRTDDTFRRKIQKMYGDSLCPPVTRPPKPLGRRPESMQNKILGPQSNGTSYRLMNKRHGLWCHAPDRSRNAGEPRRTTPSRFAGVDCALRSPSGRLGLAPASLQLHKKETIAFGKPPLTAPNRPEPFGTVRGGSGRFGERRRTIGEVRRTVQIRVAGFCFGVGNPRFAVSPL